MTQTTTTNEDLLRRFLIGMAAMLILYAGMLSFSYTQVKAESLMDLFQTDAFTGSWEVFSKFNILGMDYELLDLSILLDWVVFDCIPAYDFNTIPVLKINVRQDT
ncbi:MAG: hypothetical protein ACLR6B_04045 [Blautia sp.]